MQHVNIRKMYVSILQFLTMICFRRKNALDIERGRYLKKMFSFIHLNYKKPILCKKFAKVFISVPCVGTLLPFLGPGPYAGLVPPQPPLLLIHHVILVLETLAI